jgi:hypothetical protein
VIKKAYPIVVVTVVDTEKHTTRDHQRLANCYRPILFSRCDKTVRRRGCPAETGETISRAVKAVSDMIINLLGISAEQRVFELTPLV